jgi:hypothetical protein
MTRLQAILTAKLHRFSCPASEQLIAYYQDELEGSEKLVVAQHLRQCPHCARELATLTRVERAGWGERLRTAIRALDAGLVSPPVQIAGAVRDAAQRAHPAPLLYRAEEVEVILNLRPSRTHPRQQELSGLVSVGGQVPETIGGAQVELYRDEGLIAITRVSPLGHFTFAAMEPADYDLSLIWDDREIRLTGVRVG